MNDIKNAFVQRFGIENLSPQMEWLFAILEQHTFHQNQDIQNLSNRIYNLEKK